VLFPDPEAPTSAVVLPSSNTAEKLSKIFWLGLVRIGESYTLKFNFTLQVIYHLRFFIIKMNK